MGPSRAGSSFGPAGSAWARQRKVHPGTASLSRGCTFHCPSRREAERPVGWAQGPRASQDCRRHCLFESVPLTHWGLKSYHTCPWAGGRRGGCFRHGVRSARTSHKLQGGPIPGGHRGPQVCGPPRAALTQSVPQVRAGESCRKLPQQRREWGPPLPGRKTAALSIRKVQTSHKCVRE